MSTDDPSPLGRAQLVIGWRESVALPEWGVDAVLAKVDTGARTSAIHVMHIEELEGNRVRFDVVVRTGPRKVVPVEAHVVRRSRVRPSTGNAQVRIVVETTVRIGPVERRIELSLVSRKRMLCRMLLGRRAVAGGFLIDPGRTARLQPTAKKRQRRRL